MSDSNVSQDPLAVITHQAREQVAAASRTPFSDPGFEALQDKVDQYIADLILESVRIMKRRQADTVSPIYVAQASDNLVASSRRRVFTLLGTIGGVLLGAGISSYVEMATRGAPTVREVLIASGMSVLGAFMIAVQFTKE